MSALLCGGVEGTLAGQLGRSEAETKQWLEEKLGLVARVRGRSEGLELFSEGSQGCRGRDQTSRVESHQLAENQVAALIGESKLIGKERAFRRQVSAFAQKEGAKVRVRQRYLGSTDVLESLFGKYKDLAEHAPSREMMANVSDDSTVGDSIDAELLRQASETVRGQDVEQWLEEHLGCPQKKKRAGVDCGWSPQREGGPRTSMNNYAEIGSDWAA